MDIHLRMLWTREGRMDFCFILVRDPFNTFSLSFFLFSCVKEYSNEFVSTFYQILQAITGEIEIRYTLSSMKTKEQETFIGRYTTGKKQ